MKRTLPLMLICMFLLNLFSYSQAVSPYTTCPDVNIAIARAGTNADNTNPYRLYNVNTATGALTLVPGGPFKDPSDPTKNLQVNGIGVNKKDGFIYGLAYDGTVTTQRLVRLDKNYSVTNLGFIPSPVSSTGAIGVVNHAAGETDTAGNFFFTAFTVNTSNGIPTLDKFFIGKIGRIDTLAANSAVAVTYYQIDLSSASCAGFVSSLSTDPDNSGIKDLAYNASTNSFFSYATYKPSGSANYSGQVIEFKQIAGSSPLRYQVICNSTINSHTSETAGTLIDKFGRLSVLFTNGTFGYADINYTGTSAGVYTQQSGATGLPNPLRGDLASCGQKTFPQPPAFPLACPDANIAVLRAGYNADTTNPTYIYSVNTLNGTFTQVPGGYLAYPGNPTKPLHVNGVGVNKADGLIYGLANDYSTGSAQLVRFDVKYGVQIVGNVTPPVSPTNGYAVVNTAAGDMDRSNNYYFTAFTINTSTGQPVLEKAYIGKIANASSVNGNVNPVYYEIELSDPNCTGWLNSINTDPINSGLKDIVFSAFTSSFYSYATYKPAGSPYYSGQMIQFKPIVGSTPTRYMAYCNSIINQHNGETSGTLIDKAGNFIVLFTDGTVGKIQTTGSFINYNGFYATINGNTGLPSVIRGDLASCGEAEGGPLPVQLLSFDANDRNCKTQINWISENELNFRNYEILQSTDNLNFNSIATINAKTSGTRNSYTFATGSIAKRVYYRLKMVDNDNKTYYSPIVTVNSSCDRSIAGFQVNPNPVRETLNLNWYGLDKTLKTSVQIFDAYGKQVLNVNTNVAQSNTTTRINVSQLAAGTYFIKAVDEAGNQYNQSFIKNK